MGQFGLLAKKCFKIYILLACSSVYAFSPGESIKATDMNNYYSDLVNKFTSFDVITQNFINPINEAKDRLNNTFEVTSVKSSSTVNTELFSVNVPAGSYLCAISAPPSGTFSGWRASFFIGTVANPTTQVNYAIKASQSSAQGKAFNLTHRSEPGSNLGILFNTTHSFSSVEFKLKCRKVI